MQLASRRPVEAAPPPMGALAKLPVFLDLAGRRAVVAGGGAGAAWKAELLAAAGARVDIYAIDVAPEMAALVERGAAAGTLTLHHRPWSVDVLAPAAVALADVETDAEAHAFFCAARSAGIPVNVVDKPAYCQFQLGSIVNRSPVIVAISTDGAAPILGQAIRRRIETLLPPALAAWGALAKTMRATVAQRLARGPARRAFWEAFAERAFRTAAPAESSGIGNSEVLDDILASLHAGGPEAGGIDAGVARGVGRVTLVGAGPGDCEHLTLKAVRALQSADIILYDDLVSDDVLELARREARRMMVGKRGGRDSCAQDDINALMVGLARQGKHVVRLKCGDPMIFGRAGEEIAHLAAAGIGVTVVPGVTTASAMAAGLGVSLTHRECAGSVRFITGRGRSGNLPEGLDWQGLADPRTTLVVYMGGRTAPELATRLIEHGLTSGTPVVAVGDVGRPTEQRWIGTLAELADGALGWDGRSPVLIGVGATFAELTHTASSAPSSSATIRSAPAPAELALAGDHGIRY